MTAVKLFCLSVALMLFSAGCSSTATNVNVSTAGKTDGTAPVAASTPHPPGAIVESNEASGKELYATNCMICHKEDGKGGKVTIKGKTIKPENLTEEKFVKASEEKLVGYVTDGVPDEGMPAFKDKLTSEEIRSVVSHVRTLQR